jgi:hypothetical protein
VYACHRVLESSSYSGHRTRQTRGFFVPIVFIPYRAYARYGRIVVGVTAW